THHICHFFLFTQLATTDIYTLSLHDALPIFEDDLVLLDHAADARHLRHVRHRLQLILEEPVLQRAQLRQVHAPAAVDERVLVHRSEEHTSELQSRGHLVCRLLLEKKKTNTTL